MASFGALKFEKCVNDTWQYWGLLPGPITEYLRFSLMWWKNALWEAWALTHIWRIHYLTLTPWESQNHPTAKCNVMLLTVIWSLWMNLTVLLFNTLYPVTWVLCIQLDSETVSGVWQSGWVLYSVCYGDSWLCDNACWAGWQRARINVPYVLTGNHSPRWLTCLYDDCKSCGFCTQEKERQPSVWMV